MVTISDYHCNCKMQKKVEKTTLRRVEQPQKQQPREGWIFGLLLPILSAAAECIAGISKA